MYLTILNEFFKPERLTKLEKVKYRTIEALEKLSKNIEETQLQQEQLLQDSKLLQQETLHLETDSSYFLRFLRKQSNLCKKKHEDLWDQFFQECGEMRQELAFMFAQQNAGFRMQLLQGKSTQFQLRQQVQSMKHVNSVKKSQEMEIQALPKELENTNAVTTRKDRQAHLQFLQQKILLDRQLQELQRLQVEEFTTKEAKNKVLTAKKVNSEFCASVCSENQESEEEFVKPIREYPKLESIKRG